MNSRQSPAMKSIFMLALLALVLRTVMGRTILQASKPAPPSDVWQLIRSRPDLSVTEALISQIPYLQLALMDPNLQATFFLPINSAWYFSTAKENVVFNLMDLNAALITNEFTRRSENERRYWQTINNHIVLGKAYTSASLKKITSLSTALVDSFNTLDITSSGSGIDIGTRDNDPTSVVVANLVAGKSVVHLIGKVLWVDVAPTRPFDKLTDFFIDASFFARILQNSSLNGYITAVPLATGPYTIFVPTNAAVTSFLTSKKLTLDKFLSNSSACTAFIKAHVIQGSTLWLWDLQLIGGAGASPNYPPTFMNGTPIKVTALLNGTVSVVVGKTSATVLYYQDLGGSAFGCSKQVPDLGCRAWGSVYHRITTVLPPTA